jgi:hypothetical protein
MTAVLVCLPVPAGAQTQPLSIVGNEVLSRVRPGLDPVGFGVGGFRLYPSVSGSVSYDDNIYNVDRDIRKSTIIAIQPKLSAQSDWARHQIVFDAQALLERYPEVRTENNNQYGATLSGRLDASRSLQLDGQAYAMRSIEARGTSGDLFTRGEPVRFGAIGGGVTARKELGRILLQGGVQADTYSYKDTWVGSGRLDQSYRDHHSASFQARLGYQLGAGLTAFVQGTRRQERYDQEAAAATLDSNENVLLGGVRFAITQLISGELGVGYLHRKYRSGAFGATKSFAYDGAVIWNPTTLIALTARARRFIEESPVLAASGIVTDTASVDIDYELLRNVLVNGRVARSQEDYRQMDRRDRRWEGQLAFRYLMNRFAELGLRYDYRRQRGVGLLGRDYRGNEIRLSLTVQK